MPSYRATMASYSGKVQIQRGPMAGQKDGFTLDGLGILHKSGFHKCMNLVSLFLSELGVSSYRGPLICRFRKSVEFFTACLLVNHQNCTYKLTSSQTKQIK